MIRVPLIIFSIVLSFSPLTSAEPEVKTDWPLIYNEEALIKELKGKEEVVKILGELAVKKPSEESEENSGHWWYNISKRCFCIFQGWQDNKNKRA